MRRIPFLLTLSFTFSLTLATFAQPRAVPANDNWANAETISLSFTDTETGVFSATVESGDPALSCKGGSVFNTVWYTYTPAVNETITLDTATSNYDTVVGVFTGTPGAFTPVTCANNAGANLQAKIRFSAAAGVQLSIVVSSETVLGGGEILNVSVSGGAAPANDDFSNAAVVSSLPFSTSIDTSLATPNPTDLTSRCIIGGENSVWFAYTPATPENVTITASANGFNPPISVNLNINNQPAEFTCSYSNLAFNAVPGTTYYLMIADNVFNPGTIMLNMSATILNSYTFNVNTAADTRDLELADGLCKDGNNNCSLRAAIMEANALAPHITTINLPANNYILALGGANEDAAWSGDLDIRASITINGADRNTTIIDGGQLDRVFDTSADSVRISNVIIKNGAFFDPNSEGIGIYNNRMLTLENVSILNNGTFTNGFNNAGGAIANSGFVLVSSTEISNNRAKDGGILYNTGAAVMSNVIAAGNLSMAHIQSTRYLSLDHVTLLNNTNLDGAGDVLVKGTAFISDSFIDDSAPMSFGCSIRQESGYLKIVRSTLQKYYNFSFCNDQGKTEIFDSTIINNSYIGVLLAGNQNGSEVSITNSTISGNGQSAISSLGAVQLRLNNVTLTGYTNSIYYTTENNDVLQIENSIINGQCEDGDNPNANPLNAPIISLGHNLITDPASCATFTHHEDQTTQDTLLLPLGNNGGPTQTHALHLLSPGINAGNPATCTLIDQRGITRPAGAACDIGAYEYDAFTPSIVIASSLSNLSEGDNVGANHSFLLGSQPSANVTIAASADGQTHLTGEVHLQNFTFTPSNWRIPQTVTILANDDLVAEGNHSGNVTFAVAAGSASEYLTVQPQTVNLSITDNDTAAVNIVETASTTIVTEVGETDTYTLALNSLPTAPVTVTATANTQLQISLNGVDFATSVNLQFTAATWNQPQTITVKAMNDNLYEGSHTGTISHAVSSADTLYNNLAAPAVSAQIIDSSSTELTLLLPLHNATMGEVAPTFQWTTYLDASTYNLRIRDSFNDIVLNEDFATETICAGSLCTLDLDTIALALQNNETYSWLVVAKGGFGELTSETFNFETAFTVPAAFTLLTPTNDETVRQPSPVFSWTVSENATRYRLRVLDSFDERVVNFVFKSTTAPSINDICVDGVCTVSLAQLGVALEHREEYEWRVKAMNDAGNRNSSRFYFTTNFAPPAFELLSPADTVDTLTPLMTWQESTGATKYRLRIRRASDDVLVFAANLTSTVCTGGICSYDTSLTPYLIPLENGEEYEWFVQARNAYAKKKSAKWLFSVALP